jgi:acetyltransferase
MQAMNYLPHQNLHRINPADLELERRFIHRLTPKTKRLRLLAAFGEPSDAQLIRLVSPNPKTELALAWVQSPASLPGSKFDGEFAAVARYAMLDTDIGLAEFAIVVADEVQAQGIGRKLLRALIFAAHQAGINRLQGDCFADNRALITLAQSLGFEIESHPEDASLVQVSLSLQSKRPHPEHDTCYQ